MPSMALQVRRESRKLIRHFSVAIFGARVKGQMDLELLN